MLRVSVIIPFRGDPLTLGWALDGFARQSLRNDVALEVRVGADGCETPAYTPTLESPAIKFTFLSLPRSGVAGAKNLLLENAQSDVLIFANADTRPDPEFVEAHVRRLLALPKDHMVLGSSPFETRAATVFDCLKERSPMIFFYPLMKPHALYDYRHAWNLNVSVRHGDCLRVGAFSTELRPYGYEDLDFAHKLMGDRQAVYYEPAARVEHRHPMSLEDYLDREEALGCVAPNLLRVNPKVFRALFGSDDLDAIASQYRTWVAMDVASHRWTYERLGEWLDRPAAVLGPEGFESRRMLMTLYQLHIPLKRLAFRLGFLRGLQLLDDSRWQERGARGLWRQAIA
jgi:glycosyltransferase involved in cell wall biosynthesis